MKYLVIFLVLIGFAGTAWAEVALSVEPTSAKFGDDIVIHASLPSYEKPDDLRYFIDVFDREGRKVDSTLWFAREDFNYTMRTEHPAFNITRAGDYTIYVEKGFNIYRTGEIVKTTLFTIMTNPPPLKQVDRGISPINVICNDELVLIQKHDGSPACVTEQTKQKLIERGWTEKIIDMISSKHADVEKLLIENKINYIPDKLVITTGATIRGDPACGAVVDTDSKVHWFGIDSISNPREMTLYDENPNQCVVKTSSCFCNVQIELSALTLDELDYFTPQEQEKYANILIGYLYEENINRTPKFMIGKHNVNYTDPSAIGYCGKIWGTATRGYFSGAIVDGEAKNYGIDKELPLLCAISDDAPYFGKAFGEQ